MPEPRSVKTSSQAEKGRGRGGVLGLVRLRVHCCLGLIGSGGFLCFCCLRVLEFTVFTAFYSKPGLLRGLHYDSEVLVKGSESYC